MTQNQTTLETQAEEAEVRAAAHAFAEALTETAEFQAFEQANERLRHDDAAQKAIQAFQNKQQSLQMMIRLNALSPEDRSELERLQKEFVEQPSVAAYMQAQEELKLLCQTASELLSERIGLSFASACGPGCC